MDSKSSKEFKYPRAELSYSSGEFPLSRESISVFSEEAPAQSSGVDPIVLSFTEVLVHSRAEPTFRKAPKSQARNKSPREVDSK